MTSSCIDQFFARVHAASIKHVSTTPLHLCPFIPCSHQSFSHQEFIKVKFIISFFLLKLFPQEVEMLSLQYTKWVSLNQRIHFFNTLQLNYSPAMHAYNSECRLQQKLSTKIKLLCYNNNLYCILHNCYFYSLIHLIYGNTVM